MVAGNRPRRGSATAPFLWIFLMTGGASSDRSAVSFRALISFGL